MKEAGDNNTAEDAMTNFDLMKYGSVADWLLVILIPYLEVKEKWTYL